MVDECVGRKRAAPSRAERGPREQRVLADRRPRRAAAPAIDRPAPCVRAARAPSPGTRRRRRTPRGARADWRSGRSPGRARPIASGRMACAEPPGQAATRPCTRSASLERLQPVGEPPAVGKQSASVNASTGARAAPAPRLRAAARPQRCVASVISAHQRPVALERSRRSRRASRRRRRSPRTADRTPVRASASSVAPSVGAASRAGMITLKLERASRAIAREVTRSSRASSSDPPVRLLGSWPRSPEPRDSSAPAQTATSDCGDRQHAPARRPRDADHERLPARRWWV